MTQIIPLTKIGFFNPGRLTDEEIEQSFIARIPFFEFLLKKIVSERPNSIPQHHLIIGQRGMGKTALLIRLAAELRKAPYKDSFIPLSFPEEQYNIDRLSKFWLNCLDALADALDREHKTADLSALDTEINKLAKDKALDANAIFGTFEKWISKIKRRPVLLVDNLNLVFSKLNKEEQHQLRAIMISRGAPILIGASATAIDETVDYQAPFYDAFQINYLKKLSFNESIEVLLNLARITGNSNFADTIYSQKGRLEALYQLTGGTPRTLALLFPLVQNGFSEDIQTDLDALLDVVTPLYKARFEELSSQLQVVLDAVALHWDPINIEQLRAITLLENAQLSPQLKRLVDLGWLQKLDAYKAKGGAFELNERFFNIWYLMRRSSRRQKRELYCLTKFLESFYGNDLHQIAKTRIECISENINQIALDLALADAIKEKELSEKLRNKSYEAIMNLSTNNEGILKTFSVPQHITAKKLKDLGDEVSKKLQECKFNSAELGLQKILRIDENNKAAWDILGILYMCFFSRYSEAEQAFKRAIELDEKNTSAWTNLGILYMNHLSRYPEAEQTFRKAIELNEENSSLWNTLGNLYQDFLHNYTGAEKAYLKALDIDSNFQYAKYNLVFLWRDKLGKLKEAKQLFESIPISEELKDSHLLNEALFAYYEKNAGIAEGFLKNALLTIGDSLPLVTVDDWYRAAAVIIKLGFANSLLSIFSETGHDIIFKPFYVAIEAITKNEDELFFNSIAAEVREPAKKIMEIIKNHIS
jgi:Flp pilus assembly protein TadD